MIGRHVECPTNDIVVPVSSRLVRGPVTETDLIALRHQVLSLRRQLKIRPKLTPWDRLLFGELYKVNPLSVRSILIVKPDTVVRWHRTGFRLFWRMKSRRGVGRPKIPAETLALIREMSKANVLWGAPRIHGELLKLGIDVSQSTVAKYMAKRAGPPSQAWKTFLKNHADGIAAIDLFVVPTVGFKLLFGLVVLDHGRRRDTAYRGDTSSNIAVDCAPNRRGISMGGGAGVPSSGSGCLIRFFVSTTT